MRRNTEVCIDNDSALTIGFPQLLCQRRRRITRGPDYRTSTDKLGLELNAFGGNAQHFGGDFHLNIQLIKLLESRDAKCVVEHRQDLWSRIDQHDPRPLGMNISKIMHNRSLRELRN